MFHNYTFAWWQMAMLKVLLLSIGLLVGSTWPIFFKKPLAQWILWILFVVLAIYMLIIAIPQF